MQKGGGVSNLLKGNLSTEDNKHPQEFRSFELMDINIKSVKSSIRYLNIYRPPYSTKNKLTATMFFDEFADLLESIIPSPDQLLISGDFNFHLDSEDDRNANKMREILDTSGLQQHVDRATHKKGHLLDLVITRKQSTLVSNVSVIDGLPSDHSAVSCNLTLDRPPAMKRKMRYRKLRQIDIEKFKQDIENSTLYTNPAHDPEGLALQYDTVLSQLLDLHAPQKEKCITIRPNAPWYTDELREEKQKKRRLERKFRKTNLEIDKQLFLQQCQLYKNKLDDAKRDHHRSKFSECEDRNLFRLANSMLKRTLAIFFPLIYLRWTSLTNLIPTFTIRSVSSVKIWTPAPLQSCQ